MVAPDMQELHETCNAKSMYYKGQHLQHVSVQQRAGAENDMEVCTCVKHHVANLLAIDFGQYEFVPTARMPCLHFSRYVGIILGVHRCERWFGHDKGRWLRCR